MSRRLRSALVVEDDPTLRTGLASFLRTKDLRVATAGSAAEAITQLRGRPDLLVLDVMLPDGDAFTVLDHAQNLAPAPIRIAMSGAASAEDGFRLASYGVRSFLQKPVSLAEIWEAVQKANDEAPDLAPFAQESVGHVSLKELTGGVRAAAIRQALAISRGNRTRAAHLLRVTRQAVQQMIRRPRKKTPRA
jgi:DNA-binding NtrC family response regulator